MAGQLAIFSPYIGADSETFIRRHIEDLMPGATVAITGKVDGPYGRQWNVTCPVLVLNQVLDGGLKSQLLQALGRKFGLRMADTLEVVKRFLEEHHVQVAMGEYLDASLPWLGLTHQLGIRFYAHAHGYDVSEKMRDPRIRAEYLRYNEAAGVITMSHVSRKKLLAIGLDPAKVHVVPYGVDVPNEPLMRAEGKVLRCVAVGRMVAKKGPILTLDAFRRAAEACPTLRLDYVGNGVLFPAAQQFLRAFNLEDKVTLHGSQPNELVQKFMGAADIFVQHSMTDPLTGDEEGLPVAILEAMANSLPVVSTRHAGIPEAVQDGATGYLVDEGDSVSMAERLVHLVRDPDLRRRIGAAGWRRAREYFSWKKERAGLLEILETPVCSFS